MSANVPKARVFISCGQREGHEREIAERIGGVLDSLGYEYYIAATEASLTGLKENIYRQLEQSEYILFVDFRREQLAEKADFRGSLFSHQELAVAAYLGLEWLPFQQQGVELNGIMKFIQSNVVSFSEPEELPELVEEHVKKREWKSGWKNTLVIEREAGKKTDIRDQTGAMTRFFHLRVKNPNPRKLALNCVGYVERIRNLDSGREVAPKSVELRWAGYLLPNATVLGGSQRDLDFGFVYHKAPHILLFNSFTTSSEYMPPLEGPGHFELGYLVVAENFPPARASIRLTLDRDLGRVAVKPIAADAA